MADVFETISIVHRGWRRPDESQRQPIVGRPLASIDRWTQFLLLNRKQRRGYA